MRYLTAGGASLRWKENLSSTGGMPSGGSSSAVNPKNRRGNPAAQSIWNSDTSAITASTGAATGERIAVGLAQTGGMGGYVPIVPTAALQMMPSSTTLFNPASWEMTSIAASTSISFDWTVDLGEGI